MRSVKMKLLTFLVILVGVLILTNPSEKKYLSRLVDDYGKHHHSMSVDASQLKQIGTAQLSNYGLFSMYHYEFGSIGVRYLGIGTLIFYLDSFRAIQEDKKVIHTI